MTYQEHLDFVLLELDAGGNNMQKISDILRNGHLDESFSGGIEADLADRGFIGLTGSGCYLKQPGKAYVTRLKIDGVTRPIEKSGIIINSFNNNSGNLNQDSDFSESPITQSVTITPSTNESMDKNMAWYSKPLFKYFVWPLLVILVGSYIVYLITIIFK